MNIPDDEKVILEEKSTIDGQANEIVLTDEAIYYASNIGTQNIYLTMLLTSLASIFGLFLTFRIMKGGRVFARHALDQIDSVKVKREPIHWIPQIGFLLILLYTTAVILQGYQQTGTISLTVILFGYLTSVFLCLFTNLCMYQYQRCYLDISSLNNNFVFKSYLSFERVVEIQTRIWHARNQLLQRMEKIKESLHEADDSDAVEEEPESDATKPTASSATAGRNSKTQDYPAKPRSRKSRR